MKKVNALFALAINECILHFQKSLLLSKLSMYGKFGDWRRIECYGSVISVSLPYGNCNHPDSVDVWEFDVKNQTANFYRNTDNGQWPSFNGDLKTGTAMVLEPKNFIYVLWALFKKPILWLTFISLCFITLILMIAFSFADENSAKQMWLFIVMIASGIISFILGMHLDKK
ncbi:MAG: hypothetical protein RL687_160 [Candidatus Parcubacteria bacterium]|jgi:hypothetical protein